MKSFMAALVAAAVVVSCASRSNSANNGVRRTAVVEPVRYGYNVKAVYPHLKSSYTQGLQFADDVLWEGTGEWGESVLQRVDLESGKAEVLVRLPRNEFGEGITVLETEDGAVFHAIDMGPLFINAFIRSYAPVEEG